MKKEQLIHSVAITATAYDTLARISRLTGLTLGQLTTNAITRAYDPKKNPELGAVIQASQEQIKSAVA